MNYTELVELMKRPDKRYLLNMGAGHTMFRHYLKVDKDTVKKAKREVRDFLIKDSEHEPRKSPKILILDIETAPLRAFIFRLWKQSVRWEQVDTDWFMLTWSAKWLHDSRVMSARLTPEEAIAENDLRILTKLRDLLDECDIAIAHNGTSFDIPKIKARLFAHGLPPTAPYRQIDTKIVASRELGLTSNKLDAIATYIGVPNKLDTDLQLWVDCMKGEETALKRMEEYNIYDVVILEKVYLRLRPWMRNHPNVAVYNNSLETSCPTCNSNKLVSVNKFHYTDLGKYELYRCKSCGSHSSSRVSSLSQDKKETLLKSR